MDIRWGFGLKITSQRGVLLSKSLIVSGSLEEGSRSGLQVYLSLDRSSW